MELNSNDYHDVSDFLEINESSITKSVKYIRDELELASNVKQRFGAGDTRYVRAVENIQAHRKQISVVLSRVEEVLEEKLTECNRLFNECSMDMLPHAKCTRDIVELSDLIHRYSIYI